MLICDNNSENQCGILFYHLSLLLARPHSGLKNIPKWNELSPNKAEARIGGGWGREYQPPHFVGSPFFLDCKTYLVTPKEDLLLGSCYYNIAWLQEGANLKIIFHVAFQI